MAENITLRDLTTGEAKGSGVYDELMRTSKAHITEEFSQGRIIGESYAEVYLGVLQSNLQAGLQFALETPLRNQQLKILEEQVIQSKTQTELLVLQKEQLTLANAKATYENEHLLPLQKSQMEKQIELLTAQVSLANKQIEQVTAQILVTGKQEDLLDEQIRGAKDTYTNPTGGTNKATYDRTQAETDLVNQKQITEKYQSMDLVNGNEAGGLIGKEITLKHNQGESFLRNAELQASKVYADIFSVMYSTEPEGMDNQAWGLGSDESFEVFKKLSEGIGIDTSGFDAT